MCIIAVRPQGYEMDDMAREWLESCATWNDDGAGIMYTDGEKVYWHKGFMGEDAISKTIEYAENIPAEFPMVLHYRIGTHGSINPATTHPFPLFCDDDMLKFTSGEADAVLAHNGIISQMPQSKEFSDTQMLIRHLNMIPDISAEQVPSILPMLGGHNLYALMTPRGVTTVGDFIEEKNGWLFSNGTYAELGYEKSWWEEDDFDKIWTKFKAVREEEWDECMSCSGNYPVSELIEAEDGWLDCKTCVEDFWAREDELAKEFLGNE